VLRHDTIGFAQSAGTVTITGGPGTVRGAPAGAMVAAANLSANPVEATDAPVAPDGSFVVRPSGNGSDPFRLWIRTSTAWSAPIDITSDGAGARLFAQALPCLVVAPFPSFQFPRASSKQIGSTVTVPIENTCADPVRVEAIQVFLDGERFRVSKPQDSQCSDPPATLPQGRQCAWFVTFAPQGTGVFGAVVRIELVQPHQDGGQSRELRAVSVWGESI
jgi:hypothetical protein